MTNICIELPQKGAMDRNHELEATNLDRRLWASAFLREEWDIAHTTLEAEVNGCGAEQILGEWK